jgi:hypothetical protein
VREGKLSADVPGATLQLAAVSANEFRSVNGPLKGAIKFEKQGQNRLMWMTPEGQKPVKFEAIEFVSPPPAELAGYAGDYYSDELGVAYKIVFEGGKLYVRHENKYKRLPANALEPTTTDTFFIQGVTFNFKRNEQKQVNAFTLDAGRVRNIGFVKRAG